MRPITSWTLLFAAALSSAERYDKPMAKYEVRFYRAEYTYVEVEAATKREAVDIAWQDLRAGEGRIDFGDQDLDNVEEIIEAK
jgi:hypothetical protein